jgi:hypothetical protein
LQKHCLWNKSDQIDGTIHEVKSEDKVELFDTSTSLDVDVDNLELTGYTGFFYAVKN